MYNKTIRQILSYLKKYYHEVILIFLLSILTVVATLLIPVYIGNSIDAILDSGVILYDVIRENVIVIIILIICLFIFQWLFGLLNNDITYKITKDIRRDAFYKITKAPLKYIDSHSHGDIVSHVISDVDVFADGLLLGFTELFTGIITILGTMIIMFVKNYLIALVVCILTPLSIFVAKFISSKTHKYFEKQTNAKAKVTGFADEMINNLKVVQSFSHEKINKVDFQKLNNELKDSSLKAIFYSSLVNPSTRFVNAIIYAFVCFVGTYVIIKSPFGLVLTIGSLSVLLSYSKEFMKPFNNISSVITELQNAFVCAKKVFEIVNLEEEKDPKDAVVLKDVLGNVDFRNVYFSYREGQKLITDFNLHVKKGMRVAIVGPTGAGKTTIINLLMRFYNPSSGIIEVDNQEIDTITRSSLRNNYGMVLQDTYIKYGTVYENIIMGNKNATKEDVIKASKETFANNFIERLPNGYDTIIGDGASLLSTGEMQLLCITRIMLANPPMLILDEATSSIDTRTELKISSAFEKLMKGKTSFIVAHRLSTIKEADVILVLKDGNIIEKGNHHELIKKKGFYYQLYNSQFENA